ncbi:hypothetical protein [Fusobacterium canifelinum]|uniref:Adhesion protein FadA n=1 Tax=Fusobacterium canifelinum TaxID=285729 RepID=A0ABX7CHU2_9FUSO|nr:hypothetical protein [Fusobacterium canifelinum]QQS88107.1 hypothetical protein I6I83_02955 [Fusobacterium canifelinum]
MKKILVLLMTAFSLVVYGEKYPYTSENDRKKILKELKEASDRLEKNGNEKDALLIMTKMDEIMKITAELEERSESGDKKAEEELKKWEKGIEELDIQF